MAKHLELTKDVQPLFYFNRLLWDPNVSMIKWLKLDEWIFSNDYVAPLSECDEELLKELENLTWQDVAEFEFEGVPLGRLALASALRSIKRSRVETAGERKVLDRYLRRGLEEMRVAQKVLEEVQPDYVIVNHGSYVEDGGVFFHLALLRELPTMVWHVRATNCLVVRSYSLEERFEYEGGLSKGEWRALRNSPQREEMVETGRRFLKERISGERYVGIPGAEKVGFKFQPRSPDLGWFQHETPTVGVFTHLPWDLSGAYYQSLFPSMADWVEFTVREALANDHFNWIFRVHPAEASWGTIEKSGDLIRRILPDDATHIKVIEPDEPVSSYAIAQHICAGITIRGTLSVELPALGVPVICAGTGPASVAGLVVTPTSVEEYAELLSTADRLPPPTPLELEDAWLLVYGHFVYKYKYLECVRDASKFSDLRRITSEGIVLDNTLAFCADIVMSPSSVVEREGHPSGVRTGRPQPCG
jgi:hypothetical protein